MRIIKSKKRRKGGGAGGEKLHMKDFTEKINRLHLFTQEMLIEYIPGIVLRPFLNELKFKFS